jgi:hypothetical protein
MATGTARRRWWIGGLAVAGLLAVGVVVQAGLAVAELWDGLLADGAASADVAPPSRGRAQVAGGPAAKAAGPAAKAVGAPAVPAVDPAKPPAPGTRVLPVVSRPATLRASTALASDEPDTDQLHRLALRRAARERWRATLSPEELEERRQRQEERRAARSSDQVQLRDQQREWKRRVLDGEDPKEPPPEDP